MVLGILHRQSDSLSPTPPAILGACAGLIVFALAAGSIFLTGAETDVAALWPANAFVVATLLRARSAAWPFIYAASVIALFIADLVMGLALAHAIILTAGNAIEILICDRGLRRFAGPRYDLSRPRVLVAFLAIAGLAAPLISGALVSIVIFFTDDAPPLATLAKWYVPDALGLITIAPALLWLTPRSAMSLAKGLKTPAGIAAGIAFLFCLFLVFGRAQYPPLFLVPVALVFVAFTLDRAGAVLALFVTAIVSVVSAYANLGPTNFLPGGTPGSRMLVLHIFLASLTFVILPTAAALDTRRRLEIHLRRAVAREERLQRLAKDGQRVALLAQEIAGVGHWRREVATGRNEWSDQMFEIHGMTRKGPRGAIEQVAAQIYDPEDRRRMEAAVAAALTTGEPFQMSTSFRRANDGLQRTVLVHGDVERDKDKRIVALIGVMRDVTDEVNAKARLEESEARYRLLADAASDVVIQTDASNQIQYVSPSIRRYGYEPADLMGQLSASLVHPDDVVRVKQVFLSLVEGGKADPNRNRSFRFRRADGSYAWMEGNPAIVRNEDGGTKAMVSQLRDISERRAADEALAASEARYRMLADAASDVVLKVGPDDVIEYVSPSIKQYGWAQSDFIGKTGASFVHPEDLPRVLGSVKEMTAGRPRRIDVDPSYRMRKADGSYAWIETTASVIYNEDRSVQAIVCQMRDVSERRAAMAALGESEARYRIIAENVSDVISRASLEGQLTYVSPSALEVTGYASEELLGASLAKLMHPEDRAGVFATFMGMLDGTREGGSTLVYRSRHKAGHYIWIETSPIVIRDSQGRAIEFLSVTRDVSARVKMENDLRDAAEASAAAAAVKSNFLANMSHEIRTPLTAILGFTHLLTERDDLDAAANVHVRRIAGASDALLAIVNDVLDFSKLEAGEIKLNREPTSPADLIEAMIGMMSNQAREKGLALVAEQAGDLPEAVLLDAARVRQVLFNLIGNAVKFTEAGSIRVVLSYDASQQHLRFSVQDTGAGLTRDQQAKLFQRFSQIDGSSTRRHGGTGLGLAICKGLLDAMGGEIGVISEAGAGANFWFTLPAPVAALAEPRETGEDRTVLDGLRLLIADDNPSNRELVRAIVTAVGITATVVSDGAAAIAEAASRPYDAILMDIRMPVLDGTSALRGIRASDGPNRTTPVIAFSADAELTTLDQPLFDGVVRKPLSPAELLTCLAQVTRDQPARRHGSKH